MKTTKPNKGETNMKNIAIIFIAVVGFAFIACGNNDTTPKKCECETKAHLEAGQTCACGGEDCNCTEKPQHTHDWQWVVTTAPTDTADGEETETCTCGETRGTRPLYKVRETTITAFSKTITVKSDGTVSYANFTSAKSKLQGAMTMIDEETPGSERKKYTNMLNLSGFAIIVQSGNAEPAPNAQKQMTVGIDYLLANEALPIAISIDTQVNTNNAFAD